MPGEGPAAALLTVSEAASLLKLSPSTVRRRARAGALRPHHPTDRPARFVLAEVLALASRDRGATLPAERHVCLFARKREQLVPALLPLLARQLDDGAMAVLALDQAEGQRDSLLVDPALQHAYGEGRLRLLEAEAIYLTNGRFDAARMIERLAQLSADSGRAGRRLVLIGEMSWAVRQRRGDELLAYEIELNSWLTRQPDLTLICVYDSSQADGAMTLAILQAHAMTCLDGACHSGLGHAQPIEEQYALSR